MPRELDYSSRKKRRKPNHNTSSSNSLLRAIPILLFLLPLPARAVDDQGQALLAWKKTLGGADQVLSSWTASDPSPCHWRGITCDPTTTSVIELNLNYTDLRGSPPATFAPALASLTTLALAGANLSGTIPSQLGLLPNLRVLDLSGNALTGLVPPDLFRPGSKLEELYLYSNLLDGGIPEEIGNAASLRWLLLYDNQLSGVVPRSIGKLSALEVLRAGGNKNLHGPVPAEIGECSNLTMLGLAETSISGPLPPTLGKLKRLDTLAIYTAMLSGPIPPELGQCESLRSIYLYENSLSGDIPSEIANLKSLRNLLLWQNSLVGVIPQGLGACKDLVVVDLSMNTLTGSVPGSLGNLSSLRQLQLSVNQISGSIPPELGNCTSLTDLEMDNNLIGGGIPPELGKLRSLQTLYLWQNRLEGGIPTELTGCQDLEAMDLSQNGLTGAIPAGIFKLRSLNKLLLLDNQLSGQIPPEIGSCSSLLRFRANGNRLAGSIPSEIGLLRSLSFLDLGDNRLTGVIPAEIAGCRNLTFLDLHSNQISGTLPSGPISGLVSLQFLDVSNNSIGGPLDGALGSLTSLTKLNLAQNRFTGEIPSEIGSCGKLQMLDLSGNTLSGSIPPSIGRIESLEICLNLSRNSLSGEIPAEFSGLVRLGVLDLSHNRLTGDLQALAGLQNLVALNLSYNNLSGAIPPSLFFSKLPVSDLEGNPGLCISRCSGAGRGGPESAAARAARITTAVLLSVATVLLAVALLGYVAKRRKGLLIGRSKSVDRGEDDIDLGPPWEVTLFQKMDISVADVARGMTAANVIGKGWSGTVYRATIPSGQTIAVKRFRTCDDAATAAFGAEISALARVRHRNIVRLLGWGANRKTRLLFYDYLPNSTLGATLRGSGISSTGGGSVLEWETRLDIALGLAEGLSYLHHDCVPGILHRDVKSDNVLLGERYEACLADFGLARVAEDEDGGLTSAGPHLAGSYGYMAPEYGCMMRITRKSDVYSFGVVLLELITGRRAVDGAYGEWQSIVGWAREHLRSKKDPVEILDPRMQGRPDGQVQEMLQVLGIALLCCSNRADDRPSMKDVAALLREIRHDNRDPGMAADGKKKRVGGSDTWRREGCAAALVGLPPSARGSPAYTPSHSSSNVFDV